VDPLSFVLSSGGVFGSAGDAVSTGMQANSSGDFSTMRHKQFIAGGAVVAFGLFVAIRDRKVWPVLAAVLFAVAIGALAEYHARRA
jgi:hypothetical protein